MIKQILKGVGLAVLIIVAIFVYKYASKVEMPKVGEDGKFIGKYSIESIMAIGQPYSCSFNKVDNTTMIAGRIHTDGKNVHGEFRIKTDLVKDEFNSFLIITGNTTYTWTSLAPFGYKSRAAKSASTNATPTEQSQIVGTRDKIEYKCEPWTTADKTIFTPPSWITFSELK